MRSHARDDEAEQRRMHAGRRFGGVAPSPAADEELTWFFNRAPMAVDVPSIQGELLARRPPGSPRALERRAEALHAARAIGERLVTAGVHEARVLQALYTDRCWARAIARRLEHLAGVIESLAVVRAAHLAAQRQGRTRAADTATWLEQLADARCEELRGWREEADRACGHALAAYERVRGEVPSVVPQEER